MALIVKVFSGVLSDLFRRRKPLVVLGYGLAAVTKLVFPLAPTLGWIVAARFADRVGKGIRGAPRDALIADLTPPSRARRELRPAPGARHGRRGRRTAARDRGDGVFRRRFQGGVLGRGRPGVPCGARCWSFGVDEPDRTQSANGDKAKRLQLADVRRLGRTLSRSSSAIAAVLTLARFSEAFLVLRAQRRRARRRPGAVGDGRRCRSSTRRSRIRPAPPRIAATARGCSRRDSSR